MQWDILRLAFHGHATLVLIGDPKQAIYAFRGADVHAYLAAGEAADHRATLAQNWRSDPDAAARARRAVPRCRARRSAHRRRAGVGGASGPFARHDRGAGADPRRAQRPAAGRRGARDIVTRDVVREIVTTLDERRAAASARRIAAAPGASGRHRGDRPDRRATRSRPRGAARGGRAVRAAHDVERVPHRRARATGSSCSRRWSSRTGTGRLRRLAVSPFVGWDAAALASGDVDRLGCGCGSG